MADAELTMRLGDWHGYSAYEIAVQHGYTGTQQQWLASLAGYATVNGVSAVSGNITLTGAQIPREGNSLQSVGTALTALDTGVQALTLDAVGIADTDIDAVLTSGS